MFHFPYLRRAFSQAKRLLVRKYDTLTREMLDRNLVSQADLEIGESPIETHVHMRMCMYTYMPIPEICDAGVARNPGGFKYTFCTVCQFE